MSPSAPHRCPQCRQIIATDLLSGAPIEPYTAPAGEKLHKWHLCQQETYSKPSRGPEPARAWRREHDRKG